MSSRYFIYNGLKDYNLNGLHLVVGEIYSYNTIIPENGDKLGERIDFWIESGLGADDFVEVNSINISPGNIIIALNNLCDKLGLQAEVKISLKDTKKI